MTFESFSLKNRWHHLGLIFVVAVIVRALVFGCYIAPHGYYLQADSRDYHYCAHSLALGRGMMRPDNAYPIFWRTPGYPIYLSIFYSIFGPQGLDFNQNKMALETSIWVQIFVCSTIPILLFFLALYLAQSMMLAWIAAWIAVFHIGFVLASCYILSDALATVLLLLFFLFFYRSFRLIGEPILHILTDQSMIVDVLLAAFFLGLYTWLRPNGQFTVLVSVFILLLGACAWRIKIKKIILFLLLFFSIIGGWYVRNYQLTGHVFFCPMTGAYLQTFCAPRILRTVTGKPLMDCMKYLMGHVMQETARETIRLQKEAPHLYVARELVCSNIAMPIIKAHPFYFMYDWLREVMKTIFDPYASQIVAFVNNSFSYDPAEEFLFEKINLWLFAQNMPPFLGFFCWLEFFFLLWFWIGLFGGIWLFLIKPLFTPEEASIHTKFYRSLWLKTGFFIGGLVFMTGGFGYARLRMPVEPLMIILTLTWWLWIFNKKPNLKTNIGK